MRDAIFALIEEEYHRTVEAVLRISGGHDAGRALPPIPPQARAPAADHQPDLPAADRAAAPVPGDRAATESQEELLSALLLSINCIAAGFGATG